MNTKNWSTARFFTVIILLFSGIIGIAIWLVTYAFTTLGIPDPPNLVTIIIEIGVGVFIAFIIFTYSKRDQNRIADLITDVKEFEGKQTQQMEKVESLTTKLEIMINEQNNLLNDVRDVYASSYVHWVQLIAKNFETVIKRYENDYLPNLNIVQLRHNPKEDLMTYYDTHLITWFPKIESMELVKTFGKSIATSVLKAQNHISADGWSPSRTEGMRQMINDYIERIQSAIELKNKFLPYCDDSLKTKDESFQNYYDVIAKKQPYPKSENNSSSQDKTQQDSENS